MTDSEQQATEQMETVQSDDLGNFPDPFSEGHMVPSSQGEKEPRIPLFSGDKNTISFREWWTRFVAFARAFNWTAEVQARRLPSLVTKKAFQVIGKLLIEGPEPADVLELYRSTLQKSFGLGPKKAFAQLCNRSFESSKEDIDGYANDIVHLVSLALPEWAPTLIDELSCKFFWKGQPAGHLNTRHLMAMFKKEQNKSLSNPLNLCRDSFEDEVENLLSFRYNARRHFTTFMSDEITNAQPEPIHSESTSSKLKPEEYSGLLPMTPRVTAYSASLG